MNVDIQEAFYRKIINKSDHVHEDEYEDKHETDNNFHEDTIVAKATASGSGGIGIVRISGSKALSIAKKMLGANLTPRFAQYLSFLDHNGEKLDQGVALYFKGPHSFTGEDVVELQGHGGPVLMDQLQASAVVLGARLARPGEFLERAFLNNKIDLVQAEAIHDLIHATTLQASKGALRSLQGEFSNQIQALVQKLIQLRMYIEAAIDFPDEEIDLLKEGEVVSELQQLFQCLQKLKQQAKQGALLQEGMKVIILGKPNAGKSSFLNALAGYDAAIVTDIPGTTRDLLRETISIDGLKLEIVDTAGFRDNADIIEQEGIRRAFQAAKLSQHVVIVLDAFQEREGLSEKDDQAERNFKHPEKKLNPLTLLSTLNAELHQFFLDNELNNIKTPFTIVLNKIDLCSECPWVEHFEGYSVIALSAKTKAGIELFGEHIKRSVGFNSEETLVTARRRHLEALNQAEKHLEAAKSLLKKQSHFELLAEELRQVQHSLDEITGKFSSDDLLGKIFREFCIGK